jgi:YesN/AraC family two-component response regulator
MILHYFSVSKLNHLTLVKKHNTIDGGLHEEIAFSLHDSFIQQVEELNRLDEVKSLAKEVLYTYAEKVKQVKDERYSKTITGCKDYIFKHIYEEINHNDIAKYVDLSPKYLSVLFKKEGSRHYR